MVLTIIVLSALLTGAAVSVWFVVRDIKRLHRQNRHLSDAKMSAGGVSPAGMIFYDNLGMR